MNGSNHFLRVTTTVCLVILLALPSVALAEGVEKGQVELSAAVGGSLPMGDFGDLANTGYRLGADVGYYTSPQFVIGADFNYRHFGASDDLLEFTRLFLGDPGADLTMTIIQFTAYGKYLFSAKNVSPFLKFETGIYSFGAKVSALGMEDSDSVSDLGIGAGGGVQFKGSGTVGGFIEVVYHNVFSEDSDLTFFDVGAGLTFFVGGNK